MAIAVQLAAWCQLRRGEILGLERRDVDVLHGTIRVERTANQMPGGFVIGRPKTDAGVRTVGVPPHVLTALENHLDEFVSAVPSAPVLAGPDGERLRPEGLQGAWVAARTELRRPELHFHDLRHAGLTWLATQGATTAELMRRAGHASPAAALRYQHATDDRDAALAAALSGLAETRKVIPIRDRTRDERAMKTG